MLNPILKQQTDLIADDSQFEEISDRYAFVQMLGKGAQGIVFHAKSRSSDQVVAIKKLRIDSVQNWKEYELFRREANVLKTLNIHGVAKFYEAPEFLNSTPPCAYIVQEYIRGESLESLMKRGRRFSMQQTLSIGRKLLDILEQLHKHSPAIVHRDIKPGNILYYQRGNQGAGKPRVYLIDFGTVTSTLKKTGGSTVAGTYGYMPPEQMINDVCIQSDFYALGATALHLLTGVAPYQMPSNVFRLEYDYFLRTKAPFTSVNMAELLGLLLAPEVEKRPKNVFELLYCIEQVQKNCNPKSSRNAEAHFRPLMDFQIERSHAKTSLVLRNAEKIRGEIMCVSEMWCAGDYFSLGGKFRPGLEYIFCYKDVYWCGFWPFHNFVDEDLIVFLNKMKKQEYPISCTVEFSADEPRLNRLVSFESEGKTYQTLKMGNGGLVWHVATNKVAARPYRR